jgi:hypothetical protein
MLRRLLLRRRLLDLLLLLRRRWRRLLLRRAVVLLLVPVRLRLLLLLLAVRRLHVDCGVVGDDGTEKRPKAVVCEPARRLRSQAGCLRLLRGGEGLVQFRLLAQQLQRLLEHLRLHLWLRLELPGQLVVLQLLLLLRPLKI